MTRRHPVSGEPGISSAHATVSAIFDRRRPAARFFSTRLGKIEKDDGRWIADGSVMAGEVEAAGLVVHAEDGDVIRSLIAAIKESVCRIEVESYGDNCRVLHLTTIVSAGAFAATHMQLRITLGAFLGPALRWLRDLGLSFPLLTNEHFSGRVRPLHRALRMDAVTRIRGFAAYRTELPFDLWNADDRLLNVHSAPIAPDASTWTNREFGIFSTESWLF